jgi:hypothetical protein
MIGWHGPGHNFVFEDRKNIVWPHAVRRQWQVSQFPPNFRRHLRVIDWHAWSIIQVFGHGLANASNQSTKVSPIIHVRRLEIIRHDDSSSAPQFRLYGFEQ